MTEFSTTDLKDLFAAFAARMAAERDYLCALDGAVGDGDHGIAMAQGMAAAYSAAAGTDGTLQDIFNAAAKGFLNAVGASSGPLYATGFLFAGRALGPSKAVDAAAFLRIIPAIRDGVVHRGKAAPGEKTMLDAWHPAAEAVERGEPVLSIRAAATEGAMSTSRMVATVGRAERLGDRALGHPDPGAVSASMLIEEILNLSDR